MDKDECTVLFSVWCSSVSIANLPAIKLGESVNDHCQFVRIRLEVAGGEKRGVLMKISANDQCRVPWIQRNSSYCPFVGLNKWLVLDQFIAQAPRIPLSWTISILWDSGNWRWDRHTAVGRLEIGGGTAPDTVFG